MVHLSTDGGLNPVWWYCILLYLQFQGTASASDEVIYVDVILHFFLLLATLFYSHFWRWRRGVHKIHRLHHQNQNFSRNVHQLLDFLVRILLHYDNLIEHLSVFRPDSYSTRPIQKTRITLRQVLNDISFYIADFSFQSIYKFCQIPIVLAAHWKSWKSF